MMTTTTTTTNQRPATGVGIPAQQSFQPIPTRIRDVRNAPVPPLVVEPAAIVDEEPQGARSLYVACTRATKRLGLIHARPLPEMLVD